MEWDRQARENIRTAKSSHGHSTEDTLKQRASEFHKHVEPGLQEAHTISHIYVHTHTDAAER